MCARHKLTSDSRPVHGTARPGGQPARHCWLDGLHLSDSTIMLIQAIQDCGHRHTPPAKDNGAAGWLLRNAPPDPPFVRVPAESLSKTFE